VKDWPHFPEDQLPLFEMPDPIKQDKTDQPTETRRSPTVQIATNICPRCGNERTKGLPCPHCAGDWL